MGKKFTGQGPMLSRQEEETEGMCVSITNLFARYMIRGRSPIFLDDERETYRKAVKFENRQHYLAKHGLLDSRHLVFIEEGIPHEDVPVSKADLTSKKSFEKAFEGVEHALVSYPIHGDSKTSAHMVYFGKKGNGSCTFFNVDNLVGPIEGPCSNVEKYMRTVIKRDFSTDGREGIVGMTKVKGAA